MKKPETLIETLNKKEVDKIAGAFLLKGWRDGFARLSFPVVPSISPPPRWTFIYLFVWHRNTRLQKKKNQAPLHHKDLSLPNINKVYDPDLNVPLLLIVLHSQRKNRRRGSGRQAVDQHPYEFVFVVWHRRRVHKSIDSSSPVSALCSAL